MYRRSPELRNYSVGQLTDLLEEAGFSEIHAVSGYSSEPAAEDDDSYSILGKNRLATAARS
jgi:hypothetical protein